MRTFRFIEKLFVVLSAIGLVLKFSFSAGGAILLLLSLNMLILLYFFFSAFYFKQGTFSITKVGFPGAAGFAFSIACVGILFKFMYWPGAAQMLLMGIVATAIVVTYSTQMRSRNREDVVKSNYFRIIGERGMIIVLLCSVLFTIPDVTLIRFEYRQDPKLAELMVAYLKDPDNKFKRDALDQYRMNAVMEDPHKTIKTP